MVELSAILLFVAMAWALSRMLRQGHQDDSCPRCGSPSSIVSVNQHRIWSANYSYEDRLCQRCDASWTTMKRW